MSEMFGESALAVLERQIDEWLGHIRHHNQTISATERGEPGETRLVSARFSIGVEDAVFLRGELFLSSLTEGELDRTIGTLYSTVEQCFKPLLRIGFSGNLT